MELAGCAGRVTISCCQLEVKKLFRFLCVMVLDGISYSFGVFLGPLQKELGGSTGIVSMGGSLQAIVCTSDQLIPTTQL